MKSEKNILVAFVLNLFFSMFEFFGGILTNSAAIVSDAVHDLGDAMSIGASWLLEKKSRKQPDDTYTYGYLRYSVIGSVITTCVLLVGSILMIVNAVQRLFYPQDIHYDGMIVFAVVGVVVNVLAAFFTRHGESLNQKAVNLHMLEDILGWIVVLVGAVVMRFTNVVWIDSLLSISVAIYISVHAFSHLKEATNLFLVKVPRGLDVEEIESCLTEIEGVLEVHHTHVWSMDGHNHYATAHIVTRGDFAQVKQAVKAELSHYGIQHVTLELEEEHEQCDDKRCQPVCFHHHHHH